MKTPRKYQLWTNSHGNLDAHPPGVKWVTFDTVEVTRRKPSHRFALDSGRIFTYEVLDGFTGSNRRGWSPILIPIIHLDQMPLFRRLVTQYQRQADKQKSKRKREYARLCKTPEYQAKLAERRELRRARDAARREAEEQANLACRDCGLPATAVGRMLASNLRDIREAHSDWLKDAYHALEHSLSHGIMADWQKGRPTPNFYHSLCLAIGAYRRHEKTNYDEELDSLREAGFSWDEARSHARELCCRTN